ncbi:prostaglandin reductase 1-like [Panulirus ornatus]|uniref:prostaglandin reductase 1-like n=1 Tax=Panulirus ornatus TaxID=150431 RepID=UPI003A850699
MVLAKVWTLTRRPNGIARKEDFACIEEELSPCNDGEVIVEAEYLTVDPYMRFMTRRIPLNSAMIGSQIARIIESKNAKWPVGKHLLCHSGWRSHSKISAETLELSDSWAGCMELSDIGDLPKSLWLGILGMPGITAYFGFLEICQPKAGETVLVNGAAGAVGSAVVQIAKIKGCKVIAFAGSEEKVAWVKELGADYSFNYKTTNVGEALGQAAPEKINCYFDNVGGEFTAEALPHMADFGRISVCGAISTYNDEAKDFGRAALNSPFSEGTLIWKQLKIEGFLALRWKERWLEYLEQMKKWISMGMIKYKETITQGFDNMPDAFIGLFKGDNIGKAIIIP